MFLSSGSICKSVDEIVFPFKIILPVSIFSKPAIARSIVVFPIPEGPNKQIISPSFSKLKVTLLTLFFLLAAKVTF